MKKHNAQTKLKLSHETVRALDADLVRVTGAASGTGAFISALFPEACTSSLPCSQRC